MAFGPKKFGSTNIQAEAVLLMGSSGPITGIAYNASGLTVQWWTDNSSSNTTLTLVAGTLGTYTSSGWVERGNGYYELSLPVACYGVTGARHLYFSVSGVSGLTYPYFGEIDLTAFDMQDGSLLGTTGLATSANQTTILSQTTAASIAGAVWGAILASYNAASSFGGWINSLIGSILKTPGQPIATNSSGYVTITNTIPTPPTTAQIVNAMQAASPPIPANVQQILGVAPTLTGGNLDTYTVNASGGASGAGAWAVTVPVTDNLSNPLQGVSVSLTLNSITYTAITNSSGNAIFNLNSGTYTEAAAYPYYSTTTSGPVTVSSNMTAPTVVMTQNPVPAPAPANYCAMTGLGIDDGVASAGIRWTIVIKSLPSGFTPGNLIGATYTGTTVAGGAIGPINLPQGAICYETVGSGTPVQFIVPLTTTGILPSGTG